MQPLLQGTLAAVLLIVSATHALAASPQSLDSFINEAIHQSRLTQGGRPEDRAALETARLAPLLTEAGEILASGSEMKSQWFRQPSSGSGVSLVSFYEVFYQGQNHQFVVLVPDDLDRHDVVIGSRSGASNSTEWIRGRATEESMVTIGKLSKLLLTQSIALEINGRKFRRRYPTPLERAEAAADPDSIDVKGMNQEVLAFLGKHPFSAQHASPVRTARR